MRERSTNADRRTADLERNYALATLRGSESEVPKALALTERLDGKPDDFSRRVVDAVREDVEHIEIGFVADRDELGEPDTERAQRAHEATKQRAAV
jgi:hypothetical protein